MNEDFPLSMINTLKKYPQLRALCSLRTTRDNKIAQKILVDIAELIRQLDFKANGGIEIG
jgi:hypothetical protein